MNNLPKNNYWKGQEWWETSRNLDPQQAMAEELNELLEDARWWRKEIFATNRKRGWGYEYIEGKGYTKQEDIDNFWKKWSDGCHFWHPQKNRWYSEKWWTKK